MLETFYGDVLPSVGHYCLFFKSSKRHEWCPSLQALTTLSQQHVGNHDDDVYFGTSSFDDAGFRRQVHVQWLRSLRLDIDAGAKHFGKDPLGSYETQQEALNALVAFAQVTGLPPTYILSSGEGLHVYWCLTRDLPPSEWLPLAAGLQALGQRHGLRIDAKCTKDTARILRPPGTTHIESGRVVTVLRQTDVFYEPEELAPLMPAPAPRTQSVPTPTRSYSNVRINDDVSVESIPSSAALIATNCGAMAQVIAAPNEATEPFWRGMLGLVKHTTEGDPQAHVWSQDYDGYDWEETQQKIDGWNGGPTTCNYFADHTPACRTCPHRGHIVSPIVLGYAHAGSAPVDAVAPAVPEPAAPGTMPATSPAALPVDTKPWEKATLPTGYSFKFNATGRPVLLSGLVPTGEDNEDGQPVNERVNITTDIFWFGQWASAANTSDKAVAQLFVMLPDGVMAYEMEQGVVSSVPKLLEYLGDKSVHPLTGSQKVSKALQSYVRDSIQTIKTLSQRQKISDRLGMRILPNGDLIAVHGNHVIYPDGHIERAMVSEGLQVVANRFPLPIPESVGGNWNTGVWVDHIEPRARKHIAFLQTHYKDARLQTAIMMGIASPLMAFVTGDYHSGSTLPRGGLSVSLYSRASARGKTTAVRAAILAYGNPGDLTADGGTMGTTDNARITRLSNHGTMPNIMDEMGGATPASVSLAIHAMANGMGKDRANRDGGLQNTTPWASINLITTNTSQRDMVNAVASASDAIQRRLLELNVEDIPDHNSTERAFFDDQWAEVNRECVGALGAIIHRELTKMGAATANKLASACVAKADAALGSAQSGRFQYRGLGALMAAQWILSRIGMEIFPLPAMMEAFKVAHDSGCEFIIENTLPTDSHTLLQKALADLAPNIITTAEYTSRALNEHFPREPVGRHVTSIQKTFLSVDALRQWCTKQGIGHVSIVRDAMTTGCIVASGSDDAKRKYPYNNFNLFRGLGMDNNGQTKCYTINVAKLNAATGTSLAPAPAPTVVQLRLSA